MSYASVSTAKNLLEFSLTGPKEGSVRIEGFKGADAMTERLQELGMHSGMVIQFVGRAPFHGPFLYRMGATVVALREEEAKCLLILPI